MSLLASIKAEQLSYRKARKSTEAGYLTALIGEVEAVGKKALREPTDAEVVAMVKKFLKGVNENMQIAGDRRDSDWCDRLSAEQEVYEQFLPKQLTIEQIRTTVKEIIATNPAAKMGDIIKSLKLSHEGQYDGALASKIIREELEP